MWRDLLKRGVGHAVARLPTAVAEAAFPSLNPGWAAACPRRLAADALACAAASDGGSGDGGSGEDPLRARIAELEAELRHAELLLRETNHRAKNAFATIASLVQIEMADVQDPQAREVLQLTQERLAAVALVHQALQGHSDDAVLDLGALLQRLGTATAFSVGADERNIEFRVATQPIPVEATRAVSLALIANELLTNAFKYAFSGREGGCVELALRRSNGRLLLRVRDNGIGAGGSGGRRPGGGTGLGLVRRLAEQAGARVRFGGRNGTSVTVSIPLV